MAVTITVAGSSVTFEEDTLQIHQTIDERWRCQFTVIDYTGAVFYSRGSKVVVTDPVLGVLFTGYVIDDKQDKSNVYPDPTVEHQIDTIDNIYLAGKRTSNIVYTTPILAGKVVLDMVNQVLSQEGVVANYAIDHDTTQTDFSRGTLTNVVAATSVGDGDLELLYSASVSASYTTQAQWQTGTLTNTQANSGGDLSLLGFTRNWNDGNKSSQTLFGNGSPKDAIVSGAYALSCTANREARSRLDFAGNFQNATIAVDMVLQNVSNLQGALIYRTTGWQINNDTYAYAAILRTGSIQLGYGTNSNSGAGSFTSIQSVAHTFVANAAHRVQVVVSGNTHTVSVDGVQYISQSDATYPATGQLALGNFNPSSLTRTVTFDNFGVMAALSGTWQSPATSINSITSVASSVITWATSLSTGGTVQVQTSIDGGSTFQTVSNGGTVNPGLTKGTNCTGKTLIVLVTLSNTTTATMPDISNLVWTISGGYSSSGTRSTVPLGNDTFVRANQSGWGTAFDGQTWALTGTATAAIASNEGTLVNTTGDAHEVLGSASGGDQDATVRLELSAATISGGIELRYTNSTNLYRFSLTAGSPTTLAIIKVSAGITTTLATLNPAIAFGTGTFLRMRFRVTGDGTAAPVSLQGKVWVDGTSEPVAWSITASD